MRAPFFETQCSFKFIAGVPLKELWKSVNIFDFCDAEQLVYEKARRAFSEPTNQPTNQPTNKHALSKYLVADVIKLKVNSTYLHAAQCCFRLEVAAIALQPVRGCCCP